MAEEKWYQQPNIPVGLKERYESFGAKAKSCSLKTKDLEKGSERRSEFLDCMKE